MKLYSIILCFSVIGLHGNGVIDPCTTIGPQHCFARWFIGDFWCDKVPEPEPVPCILRGMAGEVSSKTPCSLLKDIFLKNKTRYLANIHNDKDEQLEEKETRGEESAVATEVMIGTRVPPVIPQEAPNPYEPPELPTPRTDDYLVDGNVWIFNGPYGTGKSEIGRIIAVESGSNYCPCNGGTLITPYANSGAINLQNKLKKAIKLADKTGKRSVIVIDEGEAVLNMAGSGENSRSERGVQMALRSFVDQYKSDPRVLMIITTNSVKNFDPGLMNRVNLIEFEKPDKEKREAVFRYYMEKDNLSISREVIDRFVNSRTKGSTERLIAKFFQGLRRWQIENPSTRLEEGRMKVIFQHEKKKFEVAEKAAKKKYE